MRYRLRTLLIAVTFTGMTCGNWAMVLDALRKGQVSIAQLLVVVAVWALGILVMVPRRVT